MFTLPINGEPKFLVKSYWDKEDKKHKQIKHYIYLWPKKDIARLTTLQEQFDKDEINAKDETKTKSFRAVAADRAARLLKQIERFKLDTNLKLKAARARVDRRRLSPKVKKYRRSNKARLRGEYITYISKDKFLSLIFDADRAAARLMEKHPLKNWKQYELNKFLFLADNLATLIQEAIRTKCSA